VTAKFWFGNAAISDWKTGTPVEFRREGMLIVQGKVLEYDPPRRLSYTFNSMHEPFNGAEWQKYTKNCVPLETRSTLW
jgi:uncharacterized protein YndB with AHSA1/START domain